jgi:hypothetical protein
MPVLVRIKDKYANYPSLGFMYGEPKSKAALIQRRSEIK